MKPIELPIRIANAKRHTYAEDQKEYIPLPCIKACDKYGTILIGWQLTLWERIKLLFGGVLYHQVLTFRQSLQPIRIGVEYPAEWISEKWEAEQKLSKGADQDAWGMM